MDETPPADATAKADRMTFEQFKLGRFNLYKDPMMTGPPQETLSTTADCETALRELYKLSPRAPGHFEADPEVQAALGLLSPADVEAMVRFLTGDHFAADEAAFRDEYARHRGVLVYNGRVQPSKTREPVPERRKRR